MSLSLQRRRSPRGLCVPLPAALTFPSRAPCPSPCSADAPLEGCVSLRLRRRFSPFYLSLCVSSLLTWHNHPPRVPGTLIFSSVTTDWGKRNGGPVRGGLLAPWAGSPLKAPLSPQHQKETGDPSGTLVGVSIQEGNSNFPVRQKY